MRLEKAFCIPSVTLVVAALGGEAQSMEGESREDPEAVLNEAVSKQLSKARTFEEDERRIRAEIQELR